MELAETGTDDAVEELIRMVERGRRFWFVRYSNEDVLTGIEALGASQNVAALEYLTCIYTPIKNIDTKQVSWVEGQGYDACGVTANLKVERVEFPSAPDSIRAQLSYEVALEETADCEAGYWMGGCRTLDEREIEAQRERAKTARQPHRAIIAAIQKLKLTRQNP